MAGVSIDIDVNDLVQQSARITGVIDAPLDELAEGIGRLVQEQTRRRIEEEKTARTGPPGSRTAPARRSSIRKAICPDLSTTSHRAPA